MWEAVLTPKVTGPLGRALQKFRKLGWQPLMGWWKWTYPGAHAPVNLALDSRSYVEHVFREAPRKQQPLAIDQATPTVWRHGCHPTPSPHADTYNKLRQ